MRVASMPKDLGFDRLLRYGYGGFLLLGVSLLTGKANNLKPAIEAAGSVLGPLVVFACGTAIYVFYRYLLGEWVLFPIAHLLDWLTFKGNRGKLGATSPFWHFVQLGVPLRRARKAYNAVRREKLSESTAKRLNLAHAEAHILYMTSVVLIASYWMIAASSLLFILGLATLGAALANDIRQHREELPTIRADLPDEALKQFLREHGFIT
jgi:hypothetical protein